MRGTQHQVENTATTKENLEDGYPFGGVLQSDSVKGPGTRKTSLNKKVTTDTALPSPQKRRFKD